MEKTIKKYELTNETVKFLNKTLYRIRALIDFCTVKKGDLGGFVESESNLSHKGNCWIYDNARVCDNAIVCGNALVCDSALVYDSALVFDSARVCDNAIVYGNARVYDMARVYDKARVCDSARVYDSGRVCGNAGVYDSGRVCENQRIKEGICTVDLSKNLKVSIRLQTGLGVFNNKVIAYKEVKHDLTSYYDPTFLYKVGEYVEVEDYDTSNASCSSGLHFSNMNYWNGNICNSKYLMAEIELKDIITVQDGKIRCKRAKILGVYEEEEK